MQTTTIILRGRWHRYKTKSFNRFAVSHRSPVLLRLCTRRLSSRFLDPALILTLKRVDWIVWKHLFVNNTALSSETITFRLFGLPNTTFSEAVFNQIHNSLEYDHFEPIFCASRLRRASLIFCPLIQMRKSCILLRAQICVILSHRPAGTNLLTWTTIVRLQTHSSVFSGFVSVEALSNCALLRSIGLTTVLIYPIDLTEQ